jgi:hypothetical protein
MSQVNLAVYVAVHADATLVCHAGEYFGIGSQLRGIESKD